MSDRNFYRMQAVEREVKTLYAEVSIGASGAPTIVRAQGIASIARDSAGLYTMTLSNRYSRLSAINVMQKAAAAEDLTFQLVTEDVDVAKTVQFVCKAAAVATDPSDESTLFIKLELKNSPI